MLQDMMYRLLGEIVGYLLTLPDVRRRIDELVATMTNIDQRLQRLQRDPYRWN